MSQAWSGDPPADGSRKGKSPRPTRQTSCRVGCVALQVMDTSNTLAAWLRSLRLGEMQTLGDLTIVAVHSLAKVGSVLEYRTLSQAIEGGLALVTEKPQATVPTLQVINSGDVPVLLIDGEEIVGGRQNRVVNTTVLVPAHSALELDVTCVKARPIAPHWTSTSERTWCTLHT